ncbi:MAG TPA: hypothetical protein VFH95_13535 [Candidatus Kapabacteria bacterium]|nr:hypothetical protein [Candidatus Kapabacteria bacterium]
METPQPYHVSISEPVIIADSVAAQKILNVLDDPKFDWTTFNGLLDATDLNSDQARDLLKQLVKEGKVISTIEPKTSEIVFTTKQNYRNHHNFLDDSLSAGTGFVSF